MMYQADLYLNKILEKDGVIILNAGDGQEAVEVVP